MIFPDTTMIGALSKYISSENKSFSPMNANFGIIAPLTDKIKDKKEKYQRYAQRALNEIEEYANIINNKRGD